MATAFRKTGISVVGDAPWGAHFCHFYETKQDLLDTVVPYFKAGLENKEFCLWVISDSHLITVEEAKEALAQSVPDLVRLLSDQHIEILDGQDWYFEKNVLNLERVKNEWDEKLKRALARGYDGMRASGDTFWLAEKDWKDFFAYEKQINDWITDQPMTLLCTYPLAKSGATEILDVVQAHQFVIARRQGEWEVIEAPELIQAKAEIKKLNEELENRVDERTKELAATNEELRNEIAERKRAEILLHAKELALEESQWLLEEAQRIAHVGHYVHDLETGVIIASDENYRILGLQPQDSIRLSRTFELIHPDDRVRVHQERNEAVRTGQHFEVEFRMVRPDGEVRYIHSQGDVIRDDQGRPQRTFGIAQDITERKLAEGELKKEKEVLEKIFANIPVLIGFVGEDGRVKMVNPEWERTIGWTLKELQEQNVDIFTEAYPDPSYRQEILDFVAAATGEWVDLKIRVRDGRVIDAACAVVHLSDGTKIAIAQDITERKQAEDALRRSEDQLRLVIDAIPTMAWSLGPDGVVDFLNQRWVDYTGLSLEQFNEDPTGPIHPEDNPRIADRWRAQRVIGEAYDEEMRLRRADGEYRWFLVRTAPLRDAQGKLVKWYGVSIDIEDRKRSEEKLKKSEIQFAEAQRLAHVGSWEWDLRTNAVTWSGELFRIFGLEPGKIKVRGDGMAFIHPDDRDLVMSTVNAAVKNREPYSIYYRVLRPEGEERMVHSRGHIVSDENGNPIRVFGATQDVTERQQAEEKLKETSEQLRALTASVQSAREEEATRIAREIHDELGSVLTSLKLDLASIRGETVACASDTDLSRLREKLGTMMQLVDQTFDTVRRISSELRPSILDDLGLVAAIRWQGEQFEAQAGITCRYDIRLKDVELDRQQSTAIFRVFQEAMTNVVRHAKATRVDITLEKKDNDLVLTIRDDGRGITADEKSDRLSLGLLGMRERVNLIGGALDIAGVEGKGTVITVRVAIPSKP
ncbi:MAG: hypothetical protein QOH70_1347 [Blastocatellia bacterium]|jgi:PAS domain S-box-containing protein|nr:hypothetical protein [Blastocatellia bacterium]